MCGHGPDPPDPRQGPRDHGALLDHEAAYHRHGGVHLGLPGQRVNPVLAVAVGTPGAARRRGVPGPPGLATSPGSTGWPSCWWPSSAPWRPTCCTSSSGVPYAVSTVFFAVVAGRGLRGLAPDRGDAVDPQHRHRLAASSSTGSPSWPRSPWAPPRRLDRLDPRPRLPGLGRPVRRPDPHPGDRLPLVPHERGAGVLVRLRPHPAARGVHRRLAGQAEGPERSRAGRRPREPGVRTC